MGSNDDCDWTCCGRVEGPASFPPIMSMSRSLSMSMFKSSLEFSRDMTGASELTKEAVVRARGLGRVTEDEGDDDLRVGEPELSSRKTVCIDR
jgi:hypothetical protein